VEEMIAMLLLGVSFLSYPLALFSQEAIGFLSKRNVAGRWALISMLVLHLEAALLLLSCACFSILFALPDYAYATIKDGEAEIVISFQNTGGGKLTVVTLEINGIEMKPKGKNPFPLELPSGTKARLRLHASLDTFRNGVTYEVAIRTALEEDTLKP
jgi:hypothetical protein